MEPNFSTEDCASGKQSLTNSWQKEWTPLNRSIELLIFCIYVVTVIIWQQHLSRAMSNFSGLARRLFCRWSCCTTSLRQFSCTFPSGGSSKMPFGCWILSWCVWLWASLVGCYFLIKKTSETTIPSWILVIWLSTSSLSATERIYQAKGSCGPSLVELFIFRLAWIIREFPQVLALFFFSSCLGCIAICSLVTINIELAFFNLFYRMREKFCPRTVLQRRNRQR